tara:strand:+ start:1319 stop:2164 length:846 start_codon:yes stop_codon:yes gene_type:complete
VRKTIFVADFFMDQITGGAEINDNTLIEWLKKSGSLQERKNSRDVTKDYILKNLDKVFIISNFAGLSSDIMPYFALGDYIIYEHDYKFLRTRNPINYVNYKAPADHIINYNFYKNSKAVVCLSKMHREIFELNMELENLVNINCSLFDDVKIDTLLSLSGTPKTKEYAIIKTSNPTKKMNQTIEWCKKRDLSFDLISHPENDKFLEIMSQYKNLVFMTGHPEPTPRIAVEAKLMGVNLIASKALIGVAHEYWWPWSPPKIATELSVIRNKAYDMFKELIDG